MGWTQVQFRVIGAVSSHNSDQDVKDHADWEELKDRVQMILREHRYQSLRLEMDGGW